MRRISLFNLILFPFAIIHVRIIQYRYKKITTGNYYNRTNRNLAILELLQAKEYYYKQQFSPWGKFHPSCSFSLKDMKFLNWLFPEKNFKEWDIIIWHNPEAVTYYHNKIFKLQGGKSCLYEIEIPKQLKKWREERFNSFKKHYNENGRKR